MTSDTKSQTLSTNPTSTFPSKSVTKVQNLVNVSQWNDSTAILRDYVKCFFSKKRRLIHINRILPIRKRVIILTPMDEILIYETNCTGYVFPIRNALKFNTSSSVYPDHLIDKSCTITLKYAFGSVNLVLVNQQISIWRRIISTIFEGDHFDQSLATDISLYTAMDQDLDEDDTIYDTISRVSKSNKSNFEYTDSVISLRSAHACMNLSPEAITTSVAPLNEDAMVETGDTNSNRSLTYLPSSVRSCKSRKEDIDENNIEEGQEMNQPNTTQTTGKKKFLLTNLQDTSSVRRGAKCVSYLAKRFEGKLKEGFQRIGSTPSGEKTMTPSQFKKPASPPLEILFPPLPVKKLTEDDLHSLKNEGETTKSVEITKLKYTPTKSIGRNDSFWM